MKSKKTIGKENHLNKGRERLVKISFVKPTKTITKKRKEKSVRKINEL